MKFKCLLVMLVSGLFCLSFLGCVRDIKIHPSVDQIVKNVRYTDNGDGTVTDTTTGLMWMKNANLRHMTWETAVAYCDNLVTNGYSDWRLPSVAQDGGKAELDTLFRVGGAPSGKWNGPKGTPFVRVQDDCYWSSSYTSNSACAWYVFMYYGKVHVSWGPKAFEYYVWPVRGGK